MFVTDRGNSDDGLVCRILDGLGSNKYRPVDYDKMMEKVLEKKLHANGTIIRMGKLKSLSKKQQKCSKTKQHQVAWKKEALRLKDLRHNIEMDIAEHVDFNVGNGLPVFTDYGSLMAQQSERMSEFRKDTVEPVWNLCEDLRFWLKENITEICNVKNAKLQRKAVEIQETVDSVSEQQRDILKDLENEQLKLEEEIKMAMQNVELPTESAIKIEQGVPTEAKVMSCPDEDLKVQLLSQFFKIDENFGQKLQSLKEQYGDILNLGEYGGWTEKDHNEFLSIQNQYSMNTPQRNPLVIDRLQRQFPIKSLKELLIHQDWLTSIKFFWKHRDALLRSWQRCRSELMYKIQVIFTEVSCIYEQDEIQMQNKQKQKSLCNELYEKVCKWREQKYEEMVLEMKLEAETWRKESEGLKQELERKKQERDKKKKMINDYRSRKDDKQKEEEERMRKRLEEIREELKEQAKYDWKRIKYRQDELQKKAEFQEKMKLEKTQEMEEKEKRLEALRERVRVIAQWNPARVHYGTETWHAKVSKTKEKYINIQQPLFSTNTYTAEQVTSDPRFRLEEKLRDAGLLSSQYARVAMNRVKPLHPPRPDLSSTVFKTGSPLDPDISKMTK